MKLTDLIHQFSNGREVTALLEGATKSLVLTQGPLVKQPHTTPYRLVLRLIRTGNSFQCEDFEFCVHCEYYPTLDMVSDGIYMGTPNAPVYYSNGDYFPVNRFSKAVQKFAERLAKDAQLHYSSVYRNIVM